MRIIAGALKGRRLKPPSWEGLRPTSDALRETVFNVIAPLIAGARVIDGFAGTGALGIEALSRGAAEVVFIDCDARAQALIGENLTRCGVASACAIIRASVPVALRDLERAGRQFDVVLLDPPYAAPADEALAAAAQVLAPEGVIVLEHARRSMPPHAVGRVARVRQLESGDHGLTLYKVAPCDR